MISGKEFKAKIDQLKQEKEDKRLESSKNNIVNFLKGTYLKTTINKKVKKSLKKLVPDNAIYGILVAYYENGVLALGDGKHKIAYDLKDFFMEKLQEHLKKYFWKVELSSITNENRPEDIVINLFPLN